MRDYDEYGSRPVRIVRKSGFIGKLVSFLLGIIIGIGGLVGGLVGGTYLVGHQVKIKDAMGAVNDMLGGDFDYTDYIDESYGEQTLANLVGDVLTAMDDMVNASGTLNTLNDIIPLVGTLVMGDETGTGDANNLVAFLEGYGIHIDGTALMGKVVVKPEGATNDPDTYLMDYLMDCVNEITVGDLLLSLDYPLNDILMALFYGVKGEDYDIVNGKPQMKDGKKALTLGGLLGADLEAQLYGLPVDALLDINATDPVMAMLVYGKPYRYTLSGGVVTMNQVTYTGDLSTLTLTDMDGKNLTLLAGSEILDGSTGKAKIVLTVNGVEETQYLQYNPTDGLFYAYKSYDETTGTLSNPRKYDKTAIKDLTGNVMDKVMDLTLDDVMTIDPNNKLMSALKDFTIRELPDKVNTLQLKNFITIDPNNKLLSTLGEYNISELPDKIKQIKLEDIMDIETDPSKPNYSKLLIELNKLDLFNLKPSDINGVINGLKLGEIIDCTQNDLLAALADFTLTQIPDEVQNLPLEIKESDTVLWPLRNTSIKNLPAEIQGFTISDFMEIGDNKLLNYLNNYPITQLTIAIQSLKLENIIDIPDDPNDPNYSKLLIELNKVDIFNLKASELDGIIDNLNLGDVINCSGNALLGALANVKISALPTEIGNLPLEKVLTIPTEGQPGYNPLLAAFQGVTINQLNDTKIQSIVDGLYLKDVIATESSTNAILKKLGGYKIGEIANNVTAVINGTKLNEVIDCSGSALLTTLGECTIEELPSKINNLALGEVIEANGNPILDYLINEGATVSNVSSVIGEMTVGDALNGNLPEAGEDGYAIMQALAAVKISELSASTINGIIDNLYLKDVVTIVTDTTSDDYNAVLAKLADKKISELNASTLQGILNELQLSEVIAVGDNAILAKIANVPIGQLKDQIGDKILELKLSDVLTIPTKESEPGYNHILFLMKDVQLGQLSEKINATPIKQLIPHSDEEKILDHLPETTTLATLSKDLMSLYINDVLEEDIYFCKKENDNIVWTEKDGNTPLANQTDPAQRVIKPIWWYMLYSNEQYDPTTGTYVTAEYGIHNYPMETGLPRLVGNMQDNIQRVSLQQLSDDGMITLDTDAQNMLGKSIAYDLKVDYAGNTFTIPVVTSDAEKFKKEDGVTPKEKYGELTMKEFMTYISKVLAIVDPET